MERAPKPKQNENTEKNARQNGQWKLNEILQDKRSLLLLAAMLDIYLYECEARQ